MAARVFTFLLLLFAAALAVDDMPADWQALYDKGELLFGASLPSPQLNATIGNGFVATAVGSDTMYMAGVFNGYNDTTPSHRARIQGFCSLSFWAVDELVVGYALHMTQGLFIKRSLVDGAVVEQTTYAHRTRRGLIVVELAVRGGTVPVKMQSAFNLGPPSTDTNAPVVGHPSGATLTIVETLLPEDASVSTIRVAIAGSLVPPTLVVAPNQTVVFVFSLASTLDSPDPVSAALDALAAAPTQPGVLRAEHVAAWDALAIAHRIAISPVTAANLDLVQSVVSSLYYLLSSIRADWDYSLSPGGLASNGYNGHSFWDTESWMYPPLLLFYPDVAASVLRYRANNLPGAYRKAQSYTPPYAGACMPWESARIGIEVCPKSCNCGTCSREIHITGDVALALAQYFTMQPDMQWLKSVGFPLVRAMSDFWVSRVTGHADGTFSIDDVVPPDEYHDHVDDSVFTNVGAAFTLNITMAWAHLLGVRVPAAYAQVASGLRVLYDADLGVHLEFAGYMGEKIKQADVVLLGFPMPMEIDAATRARNVFYYTNRTDMGGPAMTWGATSIALLEQGRSQRALAQRYFEQSYKLYRHAPFGIWFETTTGGASNFITGAGGFLQTLPFGWAGLRFNISSGELLLYNHPVLPDAVDTLALNGIAFLGNRVSIALSGGANNTVAITSDQRGASLVAVHGLERVALPATFARDSVPIVLRPTFPGGRAGKPRS